MKRHFFLKMTAAGAVFLKAGNDKLQIKITNLLLKRVVGHAGKSDPRIFKESGSRGLVADKWKSWLKVIKGEKENRQDGKQTGCYTFAPWKRFNKDDPLLCVGLMGPVLLLTAVQKKIM